MLKLLFLSGISSQPSPQREIPKAFQTQLGVTFLEAFEQLVPQTQLWLPPGFSQGPAEVLPPTHFCLTPDYEHLEVGPQIAYNSHFNTITNTLGKCALKITFYYDPINNTNNLKM